MGFYTTKLSDKIDLVFSGCKKTFGEKDPENPTLKVLVKLDILRNLSFFST